VDNDVVWQTSLVSSKPNAYSGYVGAKYTRTLTLFSVSNNEVCYEDGPLRYN